MEVFRLVSNTMTEAELKYIQSKIPNRHIVGLIAQYYDGDTPIRRLNDIRAYVDQHHLTIRQNPPYTSLQFNKFRARLQNPKYVAIFLSILYCRSFGKNQPMRTITRERKTQVREKCRCGSTVYLKNYIPTRSWSSYSWQDQKCVIPPVYCKYCAPDRWWKNRDDYRVGEDSPITFTVEVPKATRAFRLISYYHQDELIQAADHIYRLLN